MISLLLCFALVAVDAQSLIDAAIAPNADGRRQGATVELPAGEILLTSTLRVDDVHDLRIVGSGRTRLVWSGPPGQPAIRFARASHCTLERLEITTKVDGAECAVLVTNLPTPGAWITTACRFVDLQLPHTGGPGFRYGLKIDSFALGGGDTNNEHHLFERVVLHNYSEAGVYLNGGQAHQLRFQDCHFSDDGRRAKFGIHGQYGNYWFWNGGSMSHHKEADFFLNDFVTRCEIRNFNGEHSRRFLITGGPTGAPLAITIDGVRWDGAPQDGDNVISYLSPGPLSLANCDVTAINGNPCRLLIFPPAGLAGGSLSLRSVSLGQVGGVYAPVDRPVQYGRGQAIDEFGLQYRWRDPPVGQQETNVFRLQWPVDLPRRSFKLAKLPQTFNVAVKTPPATPLGDTSCGWSVAGTATVGATPDHPHLFTLYAADGSFPYKIWLSSRKEWRLEGTGVAVPYDGAAKQRIVAWCDRETETCGLQVNGVRANGVTTYVAPTRLTLGDWPQWGLRFSGKIEDVRAWGRALTAEEISQADVR